MSKRFNPHDGTNGYGYRPNPLPDGAVMLPPKHGSNARKSPENQSLEELAKEIAERGNDMQTTHSKDGLKVFEVSKKLVKVIRS